MFSRRREAMVEFRTAAKIGGAAALVVCILSGFVFGTWYSVRSYSPQKSLSLESNSSALLDDNSGALFLTPLIKSGKLPEARELALVGGSLNWFESYSGFLTVDEKIKSNLFFWYFKSLAKGEDVPVIVWLQSDPGLSSLYGVFFENGPYKVNGSDIEGKREITWIQNHDVIYFDNPVGTGFSFTESDQGYSKNQVQIGHNLYESLVQVFQLFPELQKREVFIMGESYGGKYAISLAFRIHTMAEQAKKKGVTPKIAFILGGVMFGNSLVDPMHQFEGGEYLYNIGLISSIHRKTVEQLEKSVLDQIKARNMSEAFDKYIELQNYLKKVTGFSSLGNMLSTTRPNASLMISEFIENSDIRDFIHVGTKKFNSGDKVRNHLKGDILDSVGLWLGQLLSRYSVLVYSGQMDMKTPYPATLKFLNRLKFENADHFRVGSRRVLKVDNQFAGFIRSGTNLYEVLLRKAGHTVILDQPAWIFKVVTDFTRHRYNTN